MKHSIRTATHSDIECHRIHKGLTSGNATRQYALVAVLVIGEGILHHLTGCSLEKLDAVGMGCQNGTIARQRETDSLRKGVHRIGREHT